MLVLEVTMNFKQLFAPSDMTEGTPWKKIILFAIPMLIGNIAQQLYSTVDSIVVGHYVGDNALAAVGSAGPIFNMLLVLYIGISAGVGIMVAQYFGGSAGFGFRISKVHFIFDFEACILGQSYVKYKNPGKTRYDISGLNNIMYNVGMEASLHGGGIYVDYSLNPVFRTGTGNDGHILSIGCMFGF